MHPEDGGGVVVLAEEQRLPFEPVELTADPGQLADGLPPRRFIACLARQLEQHLGIVDGPGQGVDHGEQALVPGELARDVPGAVGIVPEVR
jgi:hypothetical protein